MRVVWQVEDYVGVSKICLSGVLGRSGWGGLVLERWSAIRVNRRYPSITMSPNSLETSGEKKISLQICMQ